MLLYIDVIDHYNQRVPPVANPPPIYCHIFIYSYKYTTSLLFLIEKKEKREIYKEKGSELLCGGLLKNIQRAKQINNM